jgi:hypothetical protein
MSPLRDHVQISWQTTSLLQMRLSSKSSLFGWITVPHSVA